MVQAFTRGPIKMDVEKGGKFSFFNGFVCGSFVDIVSEVFYLFHSLVPLLSLLFLLLGNSI